MTQTEDLISYKTENEGRQGCIDKLNSIVDDISLSKDIEEGIYDYTKKRTSLHREVTWDNRLFRREYLNKCISIYTNLNKKSYVGNKNLIDRLKSGDINPKYLAFKSPQEIFPEHWKKLMDKKIATDNYLYMKTHGVITDQYTCHKCKGNKCSYYEINSRSLDEPAVSHVECQNCGNKWRF